MQKSEDELKGEWGILSELAQRVAKLILEIEERHEKALDSQSLAGALELMEVFAFSLLGTAAAVAKLLADRLPPEFFCKHCGGYRDYRDVFQF